MPDVSTFLVALRRFASDVKDKMGQVTPGEPEDQLRGPFENLMRAIGRVLGYQLVATGETLLEGRLGKPDYALHVAGLLAGYVELKAPGTGADPGRFRGHNRAQAKRFESIPNLLYCDGNDWGLYHSGELVRPIVRLRGDISRDGAGAVSPAYADELRPVLMDFLAWQPIVPASAQRLAEVLAPLCRLLRQDVTDALEHEDSPLVQLAAEWRDLLFPHASNEQFADAYAQTVTFALLLARGEGADPLTLASAEAALAAEHSLLSRALRVMTDPVARAETSASLNLLLRVVGAVDASTLRGQPDPWLYFYEDFLASYDPQLRRDAGVYYTPVEVVHAQVRMIDGLLTNRLGKALGFASDDVVTLDPAVGTGTYILGVVEHALGRVEAEQGVGAVPGRASTLANNIYGFEIMVGPFTVSELRVSRDLSERGAQLPPDGTHVFLTDTLENPHGTPPQPPLILRPIADQQRRALNVKENIPVIVCLGNPPYDRHAAADDTNHAATGGWVRWGDDDSGQASIFRRDFQQPAVHARHGLDVKNLYNLYVYFWRWALWKVFEHRTASGPGVVSFISASSYLDGDAFCGMRQHMRRVCDEVWLLDLGGEGRGTRQDENVFAIQTPVAIAIAFRTGVPTPEEPAAVRYARIEGATRQEKLAALEAITDLSSLHWLDCPDGWLEPFRPRSSGAYFDWPLLADLFPWQHSGSQYKRTWPIAHDRHTLAARWRGLLSAANGAAAFIETRDRKVDKDYPSLRPGEDRLRPLSQLPVETAPPAIERYAYRSFDRQWALADNRLGDFLRPVLWSAHSDRQVYLSSLLTKPLGDGPSLTASAAIPDLDHFSGRGAKDVVPLYRDAQASEPNLLPGLLDALQMAYGQEVRPEDFLAYVYGVLAQPAFTARFMDELESRQLRVPLTRDATLFTRARDIGRRLLWLHSYGERFIPDGLRPGEVPRGTVRCTAAIPEDTSAYPERFSYDSTTRVLHVGAGEFAPVTSDVYEFEVSGLKAVQSWLKYRMRDGAGRRSSPLDRIRPERWTSEFTTELLELLWVLEATVAGYDEQAVLLEAVVAGPCFRKDDLPAVSPQARRPPAAQGQTSLFEAVNGDA